MLDVEEVVAELPRRAGLRAGVAAANLRPAGEPGLDEAPAAVVPEALLEVDHDLGALGARPDERHLPSEDVPELGELVDVRAPEHPADRGDPTVVRGRPACATIGLGVDPHASQLDHLERLAVLAEATLTVEDGAPVLQLDRDRGDGQDRRRHHAS